MVFLLFPLLSKDLTMPNLMTTSSKMRYSKPLAKPGTSNVMGEPGEFVAVQVLQTTRLGLPTVRGVMHGEDILKEPSPHYSPRYSESG